MATTQRHGQRKLRHRNSWPFGFLGKFQLVRTTLLCYIMLQVQIHLASYPMVNAFSVHFSAVHQRHQQQCIHHDQCYRRSSRLQARDEDESDDNDKNEKEEQSSSFDMDGDGSLSEQDDWRAFRARLIQQQNESPNESTIDPTRDKGEGKAATTNSWAYDAGSLIEVGSVVVSRVESSLGCHDLRQPYFAKCIICVIEHDADDFTQGLILNRPSQWQLSEVLHDDDDSDLNREATKEVPPLPISFGGDISSLYEPEPLIVCLHNVSSAKSRSVSDEILPGIFITSHYSATQLIAEGEGSEDQFCLFSGFCGWDPDQLEREIDRGSWYVASVDPKSLWENFVSGPRNSSSDNVPSDGIQEWESIMQLIGKGEETNMDNTFADLMLKEWVHRVLMTPTTRTAAEKMSSSNQETYLDDESIFQALQVSDQPPLRPGNILRGSSNSESPFLFNDQFLHKSIVLVFQEEEQASIGVVLNLPTTETFVLTVNNSTIVEFPIRYGGPGKAKVVEENEDSNYEDPNDEDNKEEGSPLPLVWLHCSAGLKYYKIGKPLATGNDNGAWICSLEQVTQAIDMGFGSADEFLLVQGFCAWEKPSPSAGGLVGQLRLGNFENVGQDQLDGTWTTLRRQTRLVDESIDEALNTMQSAWLKAAHPGGSSTQPEGDGNPIEESPSIIHRKEYDLADDALKAWMQIYLLGDAEYYMD